MTARIDVESGSVSNVKRRGSERGHVTDREIAPENGPGIGVIPVQNDVTVEVLFDIYHQRGIRKRLKYDDTGSKFQKYHFTCKCQSNAKLVIRGNLINFNTNHFDICI